MVYFVWCFAMRIKRVEVQVVQDARETTNGIFKKLRCAFAYHLTFMLALLLLQICLLEYNRQVNSANYERNFGDYSIDFEKTMLQSIAVNSVLIFFTVGLGLNYCIILISIGRFIKFLTNNKVVLGVGFLLLIVFSVLYLNLNFQMMVLYWGAPAFNQALCIHEFYCSKDNKIIRN